MRREDKRLVVDNAEIYRYYRERLINLALAQFEWHGLPETCDRLYFEKSLLYNGKAAMGKVTGTDIWLGLDYVYKGTLDVYGYPTDIRLVPANGQHGLIEVDEWQFLFDNMTWASLMPKIDLYARLLWEVHNTYRSNLQQQITPYLVLTNRNSSLSIKNIFNRILGFQPVVELKNTFDTGAVTTLDTRVDFKGTELLENLKIVWAEALSMLGITAETTKKERLLADEITIDRQEDIISLNSRLLNRVEFCNKMNKKYGFNLSVNLSSEDLSLNPYPGDLAIQTMDELGVDGSKGTSDNTPAKKEEE
jgi:hypothetical protein